MSRGPADLSRRCRACLFPPAECLCPAIRRVVTRTSFLLLRHASEQNRPTNSGRWAALALSRSQLVDYAAPGCAPDLSGLDEAGTVVLFPSPHRTVLDEMPSQVVVLDATWQQARRMLQKIPQLRTMPRLSLTVRPGTARYGAMRRPTVKGGLSTLEAVAGALELLGEPGPAREIAALHDAAMARAWRLRAGGLFGRAAA